MLFFIMSSPDFMCVHLFTHVPGFFLKKDSLINSGKNPQALTEKVQTSYPKWRALDKYGSQNFCTRHLHSKTKLTDFLHRPEKFKQSKIKQMRWNHHSVAMMCAQPLHPLEPPRMGRIYHFPGNCVRKATSPLPSPSTFSLK